MQCAQLFRCGTMHESKRAARRELQQLLNQAGISAISGDSAGNYVSE
jgi:hypothetical protein